MKFIHISDLHLGKSIHGVSLIDNGDQVVWVERFLDKVRELRPDAIVVAGDVYDRSAPSGDAMKLFDHMITALTEMEIPLLAIAGNHDSGKRLSYGEEIFAKNKIYLSGIPEKELMHITLPEKDGQGEVTFWLMPYLFPSLVAQKLEDEEIHDYATAARRLIEEQQIDFTARNVLIAHQNVTVGGSEVERGGSESMVGGVGQMEYTIFDGFDYVALGHIHAAYPVGRPEVRYAGSPLCYHFDEIRQTRKGPLLVTIGEKDKNGEKGAEVTTELIEIPPLHPMRELKGSYDQIRIQEENSAASGEYIRIVLTDTRVTPEISDYFRQLFESRDSIVMELVSEYREELSYASSGLTSGELARMELKDLFADFYSNRRKGEELGEVEKKILQYAQQLTMEQIAAMDNKGTVSEATADQLLTYVARAVKEVEEA